MLSQEEKVKLKKLGHVYSTIPIRVVFEDNQVHTSHIQDHIGIITLGEKAPYQYVKHLHIEGYHLFMEGLFFHEIAQLTYTDFQVMAEIYQRAQTMQKKANQAGRQFKQKKITRKELKDILFQYVYDTNLPLLLQAIEDGAIENAMGIHHPETWNALMYARSHITKFYIQEKKDVLDTSHLMDKMILEMMMICTYGYRFHIKNSIVYLSYYLNDHFEQIRKLAILGRLQSQTTSDRLDIAKEILVLCQPIMEQTVLELLDTINKTEQFSNLPDSLFSSQNSEIAVSYGNNQNQSNKPEKTNHKYHLDLSDEEFKRIEAMEDQNEKNQEHQFLQDILKREKQQQQKQDQKLKQNIKDDRHLQEKIVHQELQNTKPTQYGLIALRTKNTSIKRSNKLANLLKRERMYASKSITKHKLEYGRQLDQQNLYRATIDGHVFYEHKQGKKKDLCVYILVDNSESMSGERIINTMKGCFELARVMQTLNIPFCITAHKSMIDTTVQITDIISFQECKKRNLLDRIFAMHVSGGTHEDIALEYALKELLKFKRQRKGFVFVLSDGDTHGVKRIHELTHIYQKEHHIDVIGIGLGNTPHIVKTYPNHLYVKDIDTLPDMLIKKLRDIAL